MAKWTPLRGEQTRFRDVPYVYESTRPGVNSVNTTTLELVDTQVMSDLVKTTRRRPYLSSDKEEWRPMTNVANSSSNISWYPYYIVINYDGQGYDTYRFSSSHYDLDRLGRGDLNNCGDHFKGRYPEWDYNSLAYVESGALNKLVEGKVSLGETLGEWRSTATGFLDAADSLLDFAKDAVAAVKHRKLSRALAAARHANDFWLNFKFGVRPLLEDVWNAADAFQAPSLKKAKIGRASCSVPFNTSSKWRDGNWSGQRSYRAKTRCVLYVEYDSSYFGQFSRTASEWGFAPLSTAWNLTPYSFVVDWFLPIGNVLSAMEAPLGFNFVDGCRSLRATGTSSMIQDPFEDDWCLDEGPKGGTMIRDGYLREVLGGFPTPALYVTPRDDIFNWQRSATAVSLKLQQVLKRFR